MTSRSVEPNQIPHRYETHRERPLTLYVTRQNQQFDIGSDLQLCDVHLVRSSVELVGEPGWAPGRQIGAGHVVGAYDTLGADKSLQAPTYGGTVNELYAINKTTSVFEGQTFQNGIEHKSSLNHGWVDVHIEGLTDSVHFMRDDSKSDNQLEFCLPTDSGLLSARTAQQNGPPQDVMLERVKLQQRIRVRTSYVGTAPLQKRVARFVEDFADSNPSTYRDAEGFVKYFDESGLGPCQLPANLISCMILQFKVKPRTQL